MANIKESIIYLDHNATTPLLPQVMERMQEVLSMDYGNPSSPHQKGRKARNLLEDARERIAHLLAAEPRELIFTSGGSESNNTILRQLLFREEQTHFLISAVEHPSVLETARWLSKKKNLEHSELPVDRNGRIIIENLKTRIRPETTLISVMAANNETGAFQPIQQIGEYCRERGIVLHSDCVQISGKLDLKLYQQNFDFASLTAHKIGGPKGIGLLYIRKGTEFFPLISGGSQERNWRAGTESIALVCGYAEAMEWFSKNRLELEKNWREFTQVIIQQLHNLDQFFLISPDKGNLPNTLNIGFRGISAESLLISLDLDGIAVSSGSACSSGAMEASHVLLAMGYSYEEAKSSLRISMGWNTSQEDIEQFCVRVKHHVKRLVENS